MYLPELVQKSAVIIADNAGPLGSGFFLSTRSYTGVGWYGHVPRAGDDESLATYIVTAAHVVQALGNDDAEVFFLKNDGTSGRLIVRSKDWRFHPTQKSMVDVAAAPLGFGDLGINHANTVVDFTDIAVDEVVENEGVGPGDELYIAGLFNRLDGSAHAYTPIVRTGNVAMLPKPQPMDAADKQGNPIKIYAHLIETRSIGGLSGSPVFVDNRGPRMRPGIGGVSDVSNAPTYFFGLIRGHWNLPSAVPLDKNRRSKAKEIDAERDQINTGIALVVPAQKVFEVVNQEEFVKKRQEHKRRQLAATAPTADSAPRRGPAPTRLKLEGDFADRIKDSFKAAPPKKGRKKT